MNLKLASLLLAAVIFTACQDDELPDTNISQEEDCITGASTENGRIIAGEYIVSLPEENQINSSAIQKVQSQGRSLRANIRLSRGDRRHQYLVKLTDDDVAELESQNITVEPDRIISACGCFSVVDSTTIMWNVARVGFGDGNGKTAWIIDSGIDSDHKDLNVDKSRSKSFLANESSYDDENGHGTHVGGIIGAINNDYGILGVASGASLVALRVLDENGDGKLSALMNALSYVEANGHAGDVVNISISFPESSEILENKIKEIAGQGIYFTLAAGNDGADADNYSPARTSGDNIFTVSAIDSLGTIAQFSNFGSTVDFAAPGVNITSTYKNGKYAILSGTSMAAPHVAGILLINNGVVNTKGAATGDPDDVSDALAHQ